MRLMREPPERWLAVGAALALVIGLAPLLLVVVPPLQDMPNHVARVAVIAAGGGDPELARFYAIDWVAIPNLALDLIGPPLARVVGADAAVTLFTALAMGLVATGPFAVQQAAHGRPGLAPLIGLVLLHNEIVAIGLFNYHFGVGLALWGTAGWIALADRPRTRVALGFAVAVGAYVCHVMAAGLFGLGVLIVELGRLVDSRTTRTAAGVLARLVPALAAFAALPIAFLASASARYGSDGGLIWTMTGKEIGLVMALRAYEGPAELIVWLGLALIAGLVLLRRAVRPDATAATAVVVCLAAYVAVPRAIFDGWLVDQRLPHGMILLGLGLLRIDIPDGALRRGVIAAIVGLCALRAGDVALVWQTIDHSTRSYRAAVEALPRGARIGVLLADAPERSIRADATLHLAAHAVVTRSALVSSLFAERGKQVVQVRPPWNAHVHPGDIWPPTVTEARRGDHAFTARWPEIMDAIVVLHETMPPRPPWPGLRLIGVGPGFALWSTRP